MRTKQNVADHVARLLDSKYLHSSPSVAKLLTYCVTRSLAGDEENLKESTIGVLCFDRDPGYDTKLDPIVRVTARRLREKLALFYEGDGASETVRIFLPKGGYIPRIDFKAGQNDDSQSASIPVPVIPPAPVAGLQKVLSVWMRYPMQSGLVALNLMVLFLTFSFVHFSQHPRIAETDAVATHWALPTTDFGEPNRSVTSPSRESDVASQSASGETGVPTSTTLGNPVRKIAADHQKQAGGNAANVAIDTPPLEAASHEAPATASVELSGSSTHFAFVEPRL